MWEAFDTMESMIMTRKTPWTVSTLAVLAFFGSPAQGQKATKDERPTAAFRAEHKAVQEHLRHIHEWAGTLSTQEPAVQKETMLKAVSFFEKHIKPHAEWEERALYPIVDRLAGGTNPFTSTMRYEHRVVARWTAELRAESDKPKPSAAKFARRTDNLLGLLWAHFEEEEEVLLPYIDKGLTNEQFEHELGEAGGAH